MPLVFPPERKARVQFGSLLDSLGKPLGLAFSEEIGRYSFADHLYFLAEAQKKDASVRLMDVSDLARLIEHAPEEIGTCYDYHRLPFLSVLSQVPDGFQLAVLKCLPVPVFQEIARNGYETNSVGRDYFVVPAEAGLEEALAKELSQGRVLPAPDGTIRFEFTKGSKHEDFANNKYVRLFLGDDALTFALHIAERELDVSFSSLDYAYLARAFEKKKGLVMLQQCRVGQYGKRGWYVDNGGSFFNDSQSRLVISDSD